MRAQIHTIAFCGIETIVVTVQIHVANSLPAMAIVGLALPPKRIMANLAPADVLKEGTYFDLSIALVLMGKSSLYRVVCQRQLLRWRLAAI